jgi:2-dehydro-3-deoxyglucarate aldolase
MDRKAAIEALRNKLRDGGVTVGTWMQIPHPSVAEILGQAGYEWVAFDLEHGAISAHQLPDLCRAVELGNTLPLVRLARAHSKDCKQALDAGSGGVIVPMVSDPVQLSAIRDACRWPPAGTRGVGFSRANLFGKNFEAYGLEAQAPLLVAMIEHVKAVQRLPEILSVPGLDAILIGPYDLSASMGLTGKFLAPEFIRTMEQIQVMARHHNVASGIHEVSPSLPALDERLRQGFRFVAYGTDALFLMHGAKRSD